MILNFYTISKHMVKQKEKKIIKNNSFIFNYNGIG
jgi:hypothetical protein